MIAMTKPPTKATERCFNCAKEIVSAGGAGGLCPRCYQHKRRHGVLPPKELILIGNKHGRLVLRLDASLGSLIDQGAEREGCTRSEWVRRACRQRADSLKLKAKP